MTTRKKFLIAGAALIAALAVAIPNRYALQLSQSNTIAWRLDRWTGNIVACGPTKCFGTLP